MREERDVELGARGWTRRFTAAPPRLNEVAELYVRLGLEVLLDPIRGEELPEGCGGCTAATSLFKVVYTRPRGLDADPAAGVTGPAGLRDHAGNAGHPGPAEHAVDGREDER